MKGVSHTTKSDGNIFIDLGFEPKEANRLAKKSQQRTQAKIKIRDRLMSSISDWIQTKKLTQLQAATKLGISRPRVSDVINKKYEKFTIDALVEMLNKAGKTVTISIL